MVSRQGQVPLAASLLLTVAGGLLLGVWAVAGGLAVAGLLVWAFREDAVSTPALPLAAVSPATGALRSIGPRPDPWLAGRESVRVVVQTRLPGFAVLRAPLEGQVKDFWVRGGLRSTSGASDGAGEAPEDGSPTCYTLWIQTDEGDDVVVAVHGRRVISRFRSFIAPGERVGHGHALGFIYFARAVSIYLPREAASSLGPGAHLTAGTTVVATLQRDEPGA